MIHFLLAVVAAVLILIHVILLHRQSPQKSSTDLHDNVETLLLVLVKDLAICLIIVCTLFNDNVKTLVHPDN